MRIICISLIIFMFFSCDFFNEKEREENIYNAKVKWTIEFTLAETPLFVDNYGYISTIVPRSGTCLVKINLDSGEIIWESDIISLGELSKPHKIGDFIYQPVSTISYSTSYNMSRIYNLLYVYNDTDGKLAATVSLGNNYTDSLRALPQETSPVVSSGSYLFWGNSYETSSFSRGLMCLNTNEIDFLIDPKEIQLISPVLVWEKPWGSSVYANILSENGIIYFISSSAFNNTNPEYASLLVTYNVENKEVVSEILLPIDFKGWSFCFLILNGEVLHIVEDSSNISINKNDGSIIYYNSNETDAYYYNEITLHDNRLYSLVYSREFYQHYLISLDTATGKLAWYSSAFSGSLGSPRMYGGKAYVMAHNGGLRIYDINKNNNNFIGVDRRFNTYNNHSSFIYRNLFIFFNESEHPIKLTAILCE